MQKEVCSALLPCCQTDQSILLFPRTSLSRLLSNSHDPHLCLQHHWKQPHLGSADEEAGQPVRFLFDKVHPLKQSSAFPFHQKKTARKRLRTFHRHIIKNRVSTDNQQLARRLKISTNIILKTGLFTTNKTEKKNIFLRHTIHYKNSIVLLSLKHLWCLTARAAQDFKTG